MSMDAVTRQPLVGLVVFIEDFGRASKRVAKRRPVAAKSARPETRAPFRSWVFSLSVVVHPYNPKVLRRKFFRR